MKTVSKKVAQEAHVDNERSVTDVERSDSKQNQGQSKHITNSPEAAWDEAFLVTFDLDDADNPLNWSTKLKWRVTAAMSGTGFVRIMVSTVGFFT